MSDFVLVTGHGHVDEPPDIVVAQLGAQASASEVAGAMAEVERAMSAMSAAAREYGVADADIRTTGMSIQQEYDHDGRPKGFAAAIGLALTLRDLARAGAVVAAVTAAAAHHGRIHGLTSGHDDPESLRAVARDLAFENARGKAARLAELAGRGLGPVLRIRDQPAPGGVILEQQGFQAMAGHRSLSVEPGRLRVSAAVTVRWQLV